MNSRHVHLAAALILVLLPVKASLAEPAGSARQWLERMIQAAHTLNYDGIFMYIQGQNLEAMHVIHQGGTGTERQRLVSLNGPLREVVVADNHVICVVPAQPPALDAGYRHSPFPITLSPKLDQLATNYEFNLLGEDRVAGMNTQVIAIQPRDKLRFGYRLWLEAETGMVLRSALFDEAGHLLEQMMFTSVQFKRDIDPALFAPPPSATPVTPPAPEPQPPPEQAVPSAWTLAESDLPRGFTRVMHNRLPADSGRPAAEHIVLTDGLATVSIFLEPLASAEPLLQGPAQMGAMNAFGTVLKDHQVLVVGEVPQATVQMIAAALHAAHESAAK